MTTGERIRKRRRELKITLESLAKACGTTKQTINKYENGTVKEIPISRIEMIANVLGVSPAYLVGWEN